MEQPLGKQQERQIIWIYAFRQQIVEPLKLLNALPKNTKAPNLIVSPWKHVKTSKKPSEITTLLNSPWLGLWSQQVIKHRRSIHRSNLSLVGAFSDLDWRFVCFDKKLLLGPKSNPSFILVFYRGWESTQPPMKPEAVEQAQDPRGTGGDSISFW